MSQDIFNNGDLMLNEDDEFVQSVVLAAAIDGNPHLRARMGMLVDLLDEPFRTITAVLMSKLNAGEFVDRHTIGHALTNCKLVHESGGFKQELTPKEAVNLIICAPAQPGQAEAYAEVLEARMQEKKRKQQKERVIALAQSLGFQPEQLRFEVERWAQECLASSGIVEQPSELLELIPSIHKLLQLQKGSDFLGLDSGFQHFNNLCNGLDTGLLVLAAPPGRGKTTLAWQMACQVAEITSVPVIFISMEQGKTELRAKTLARLSKLQYRHILRGRLNNSDSADMQTLLEAATRYGSFAHNLTVIEGDVSTTIHEIEKIAIAKLAKSGANRCLIVIDYLQVIPADKEDIDRITSPKDRVDLHLSALRRLARRLDSPVLAISSENRAGYGSKHLDVFKESGGIEYSADVAMILSRGKRPVDPDKRYEALDLNIVKHRNGEPGVVQFKFYPQRAEFIETGLAELEEPADE